MPLGIGVAAETFVDERAADKATIACRITADTINKVSGPELIPGDRQPRKPAAKRARKAQRVPLPVPQIPLPYLLTEITAR